MPIVHHLLCSLHSAVHSAINCAIQLKFFLWIQESLCLCGWTSLREINRAAAGNVLNTTFSQSILIKNHSSNERLITGTRDWHESLSLFDPELTQKSAVSQNTNTHMLQCVWQREEERRHFRSIPLPRSIPHIVSSLLPFLSLSLSHYLSRSPLEHCGLRVVDSASHPSDPI